MLHEPSLTESLRLHNYISAKAANGRNLSCNIYFFPFLPLFIDDHKVYIFFFVTKPYPKRDAIKNYWGLKRKTGYFYRLNSGIFWDVCVCVCVCVCLCVCDKKRVGRVMKIEFRIILDTQCR